jgi:hypothetical protein
MRDEIKASILSRVTGKDSAVAPGIIRANSGIPGVTALNAAAAMPNPGEGRDVLERI